MAAEQFGHYRLETLIGQGGMGEVYRAYDTVKDRFVALKRLPPQLAADAEFQTRFRRESKLAARLREPHIIPIHDFGEIDGRLFLDMRLVKGTDLAAVLTEQGGLPPARAVSIVAQIASALDEAHADGLVHRDVKPSNILLAATTVGDDFVYLVDFGIAHATEATRLTRIGMAMGTLDYMAPERQDGNGDHRADIYSLACLLYESLTGRPPFPVEGQPAQMSAHRNLPPPRPSAAGAGIPAGFDEVVARGMAKNPDERYPSAGELAAAARAASSGPTPRNDGPVNILLAGQVPVGRQSARTMLDPGHTTGEFPENRHRSAVPRIVATIAGVVVAAGFIIWFATDDPVSDPITVIENIDVDHDPVGVVVSPDGSRAYLTNSWFSDTVWVIDIGTNEVLATPHVGDDPWDVAVSPDGSRAYVTNNNSNTVSVLDTRGNSVIDTIVVGEGPEGVAVSPDGSRAYVTNNGSNTVSVLDTGNNRVASTIAVGDGPRSVTVSPDGRHVYVTNNGSGNVSVIDTGTNRIITTITVRDSPWGVAVSPDGRHAYIANRDVDTVSVIDTANNTLIPTPALTVDDDPRGVAVSPDGRRVYVTNYGSDTVSVIDTGNNTVIKSIDVDDGPWDVAVSPDGRRVYVTNYGSNTVSVIDTGLG